MRIRRLLILTVVLVTLVFSLPLAGLAKDKDTLIVAFPTKFGSMDQYKSTQRVTINIGYLMWDPLVLRDPDSGEIKPHLAKSWKLVEPTVWEFKLVEGVTFHNGNPLNAECVRYTVMDRILAEEQKSPQRGNFKWIVDVKVIDDHTFQIITEKPYPLTLERLNVLFVYDPISTKEKGDDWLAENPMGTGPYRFVKWDRGAELVMTANEKYWIPGLPKIKNLTIKIIPETSTRVAEAIAGNIDVAVGLEPDQWETVKKAKGINPLEVPILRLNFWQFDSMGKASKSPLMDKRVRQAIIYGIDRDAIIKTVMGGHASALHSPMHPLQFGYDEAVQGYSYDPEKARALLKEAGYEKGFDIDLWQYYGYQNFSNQAAMGYLAELGINVNLKDYRGNVAQIIKLRNAGKVTGIGNFTWGSYNIFDSDAILPAWFMTKESKCYTDDPELDEMLNEARYSVDPDIRKGIYGLAQKRIMEEAYWMPFFIVHQIYAVNDQLNLVVGRDEVPRLESASWK